MKKFNIIIGIAILAIVSCTKEEFVDKSETPVFTTDILFSDDTSLDINAGDEEFYMYASHQEMSSGDKVFSGRFGKLETCESTCSESLDIKIHHKSAIGDSIITGEYNYFSKPKDGYKHTYTLIDSEVSSPNEFSENATWKVGNRILEGSSITFDTDEIPQDKIELKYQVPQLFYASLTRDILPRTVDHELKVKVERRNGQGLFLVVETSAPFLQVLWSDGSNGREKELVFGVDTYTAIILDASGVKTNLFFHMNSFNFTQDYEFGFMQVSEAFAYPNNSERSVSIEYTSPEGVFFSTSTLGQILPFYFEVLDVGEYQLNENGEPTLKIQASFDCILFGEEGSTKRVRSGDVVFAVSY